MQYSLSYRDFSSVLVGMNSVRQVNIYYFLNFPHFSNIPELSDLQNDLSHNVEYMYDCALKPVYEFPGSCQLQ